ncbi:MAG TPA: serine hydrolase [Phycisphaerales bacterium]|nr:serine hydrolase [Phycisphaerales bacterium]
MERLNMTARTVGLAAAAMLAPLALAQNDRINDQVTGWWYYYNASPATIDAEMANNRRPFNIGYTGSNYDVILVANSGEYAATGMDAYWGVSIASLNNSLANSNNRIIDLEIVDPNLGTYSAVVVDNSGATAAPGWDWDTGLTFAQLAAWPAANNLRPIDVDVYQSAAGTRYSVVGVPNTGSNQQDSWWLFGASEADVNNALNTNGARLIDIDVVDDNPPTFNVIMVGDNAGLGAWYYGLTSADVSFYLNQNGARLTCLHRYSTPSGTRFAIAMVDNSNAQTRRLRSLMNNALSDGVYGFHAQRVGFSEVAGLNDTFDAEPASMIKIMHAAYAIDRCASGLDALGNNVYVNDTCNSGSCPSSTTPCSPVNEALSVAMQDMLVNSDNGRTMAIELRYGRANINNWAANLGLSQSAINRRIGCLCQTPDNVMSMQDVCDLYEMIADGTIFNQGWEDTLHNLMSNGTGSNGTLGGIITDEAADTNLTNTELAQFRAAVTWRGKGGSSTDCNGLSRRSTAGWCELPHRGFLFGQYVSLMREYTAAAFVNDVTSSTEAGNMVSFGELLREQVREALQSWDNACTTPVINNEPDSTQVFVGDDAAFTVGLAAGSGSRTYQWQYRFNNNWVSVPDNAQYSGVTTSTLTVHNCQQWYLSNYRCIVTDVCGTDTSATAVLTVSPAPPPTCDDIDFNNDGLFPDTADIDDFLSVFSGGPCSTNNCGDIDFNNDGLFPDTTDIDAYLAVFSGGACV